MRRRNFITGTVAAATVLALPMGHNSVERLADEAKPNTFAESDTFVQRIEKLNELMGTDFTVRAYYPKEYDTAKWNKPGPNHYDEAYFLAGTSERLIHNRKAEWVWGLYLERNGERWSGTMTPLEYLDWTAQVALGYRIAKAQQS